MEFFKSVGINRIQVGKEHQRDLGHLPDATDQFDHTNRGRPGVQGTASRHLIHNPVCQRVGKRQPQLDHIHPAGFQGLHVLQGLVQRRITGTDVCHKCLAARLPQRGKSSVQTGSHKKFRLLAGHIPTPPHRQGKRWVENELASFAFLSYRVLEPPVTHRTPIVFSGLPPAKFPRRSQSDVPAKQTPLTPGPAPLERGLPDQRTRRSVFVLAGPTTHQGRAAAAALASSPVT